MKDKLDLEVARRFDARPTDVFDAWLMMASSQWRSPPRGHARFAQLDARVGGQYRLLVTPRAGEAFEIAGVHTVIERPTRLAMTWLERNVETTLVALVRPAGAGSTLVVRQSGFVDRATRDRYVAWWTAPRGSLDTLADWLAEARAWAWFFGETFRCI
jgi:uncharacterized protein YndB with AHSA1/START domain